VPGVRRFSERFRGLELAVAFGSATGWRFVVDELRRAGAAVHLAEPAETAARRGNKQRAKSDRADARHIRELLTIGRLPESWIPPDHLLDLRAQVRLRHTLSHQRGEWQQRIQAVLYHHGCPQRGELFTLNGRDGRLRASARHHPGCKALLGQFGAGELTAVTILAELGDARRFSSSRDAVRFAGLDITVHQSDQRRAPGHLSRQGPPALRWALFEASMCVARKILKRSYHLLRELGDEAIAAA